MAEPFYSYTVRVKETTNERLKASATKYGMSISGFINYCIEDVLNYGDNNKPKERDNK